MGKWLIRIGLVIIVVCVIFAIPICRGRINSSKLIKAVEHNDIALVKSLLDKGIDVNTQNKHGVPLLHQSVARNHPQLTQLLLDNGADINIRQKALNVNSKDYAFGLSFSCNIAGFTALHVAVSNENLEMTKLLLENDADVNAKSDPTEISSNTPLFNDSEPFIKSGFTPLQQAVLNENLEIAKLLIDHGAEINIKVQQNCDSPLLHYAVSRDNLELTKLLLENGADVNAKDYYGRNPLHEAIRLYPQTDIVELLLEYGADVNVKEENKFGLTPLHNAAIDRIDFNPEVVDLLLEHGADINAKSNRGMTPLFWASILPNIEMVKLLISRGADLNAKIESGATALYNVSKRGETDLVQSLLDAGAQVNIKTNSGETPLDIAIKNGHTDTAELLRKHGAKTGAELNTTD